MVFHGQPSKACAECRQRRTKCDLLRPSCSQCVRARRVCPGYREELTIRDESQALSAKFGGKGKQKERPSSPSVSLVPAVDSTSAFSISINTPRLDRNIEPQSWIPSMILAPTTSVEDQATCFFFGNYVAGTELANTFGNYQYLSTIYADQPVGVPLRKSVAAIGLAGLANFWRAPTIMTKANIAYCSALRLVNSELANIGEAKSDQTLVAIMLLGLYEINTSCGPRSMKSWTEHILGAAALVKLRGKESLLSPLGRNIFVHLRNGIIASCIHRHTAVPPSVTEMTKVSIQYESPVEAASTNLGLLITEHAALRASLKQSQDYDINGILSFLWELDKRYLDWSETLPPEFVITRVPVEPGGHSQDVFGDYYNTYSSIWIAGVWNNYRCARILANELLRHLVSHVFGETEMQGPLELQTDQERVSYDTILAAANSSIQTLSNDICCSVPFFFSTTTQDAPRALAGNLLLWPLYLAAQTTVVTDEMRRWAADRLAYIGETMGIRQAGPMAMTLRRTLAMEGLADAVAEMSMKDAL